MSESRWQSLTDRLKNVNAWVTFLSTLFVVGGVLYTALKGAVRRVLNGLPIEAMTNVTLFLLALSTALLVTLGLVWWRSRWTMEDGCYTDGRGNYKCGTCGGLMQKIPSSVAGDYSLRCRRCDS